MRLPAVNTFSGILLQVDSKGKNQELMLFISIYAMSTQCPQCTHNVHAFNLQLLFYSCILWCSLQENWIKLFINTLWPWWEFPFLNPTELAKRKIPIWCYKSLWFGCGQSCRYCNISQLLTQCNHSQIDCYKRSQLKISFIQISWHFIWIMNTINHILSDTSNM